MKIDFNRIDPLNARMKIVIEREDYAPKLDENLKKYSKQLNLKGFRSGKTPKSVLTKMYGKGLLEETVTSILNEQLFKYLEDEKIEFFGSPLMAKDTEPVDFNLKTADNFTFQMDVGIKPVFDLQYKIEEPLEVLTVPVDPDSLEQDIMRYRRIFGEEVTVSDGSIEDNDRVFIKLNKVNAEGRPDEDSIEEKVDLSMIPGQAKTTLPGLKTGDSFQVNLEEFLGYDRKYILNNILKQDADPDPENPLNYQVEVGKIQRPQATELTGEQISNVLGRQIDDEEAFRKILEERDMNENLRRTGDMKKMAVRLALLNLNPFEIPEEFLLKWVNEQREKKIEPGSREANNLFREAKWSLLLNRISKDAGLEITERDVDKQVTKWIVENTDYRRTDIRKLLKELRANEYFMSNMKENALEEVVFDYIMPRVRFVEKEASADEFEHAFHDMHHELFDHGDHSHEEYH